jgi:hypothetical protein
MSQFPMQSSRSEAMKDDRVLQGMVLEKGERKSHGLSHLPEHLIRIVLTHRFGGPGQR